MKKLSVVIPCFNEERTVADTVALVQNTLVPGYEKEIIVVDDGSTDRTRSIIASLPGITVILHDKNTGKGGAVKSGFLRATGDVVLIQDADLEYSPSDYGSLLGPIDQGYADVVYGSRFLGDKPHRVFNFHHFLANQLITFFSNLCTNLNLSDVEVGYKVFNREVYAAIAPTLQSNRFGIEIELTAKTAARRCRIYEVSISYRGRSYEEGKKIGWKDGVGALWHIVHFNFLQSSRLFKYLAAGCTGALTLLTGLYVLHGILGLWYILASALAFCISTSVSFMLQKYWTWGGDQKKAVPAQIVLFVAVAVLNLIVNVILMFVFVDLLHIWYILAQILSAGLVALWSFFFYHYFIFNSVKHD